MIRRFVGLAVALALVVLPVSAAAQPDPSSPEPEPPAALEEPLRILSPFTMTTDGGSVLRLPPGYFVDEPGWARLDTELRRLQDAETRLEAENVSLRESVSRAPPGGWRTLVLVTGALAAGIAIGAAAYR